MKVIIFDIHWQDYVLGKEDCISEYNVVVYNIQQLVNRMPEK
jgi:hypothetical protein